MGQFTFLFYFVLFAATAGATFAFMWKLMSTTLEESRRPPRRDTLHPEMRDIQSGEELLVFRADPEGDDGEEDDMIIVRK